MRKILIIILCGFIILSTTGCKTSGGNISNVKIKDVESTKYSKEDIYAAIDTIIKEFEKDWDGCTLKEIYYAGDETSSNHQDWAKRNNKKETIVLLSTFEVDSSGGDQSLNPNETYNNWNWILVRNKGENWIHVDHGY